MCSTRKRDFASCIRGLLQEGHQQIFVLHSLAGLWADRSAAAARFASTHSHEAAVSTQTSKRAGSPRFTVISRSGKLIQLLSPEPPQRQKVNYMAG